MFDTLDAHDRNILREMQEDGRAPVAQIAERIGLSRPAVAERIDKLEKLGIIRGTTTVVHPAALRREVTAFISARRGSHGDAKFNKAFKALLARDEIREVHSVAGEDCYLIKVQTDSIQSLNEIVSSLYSPPLELQTRTTIVMATHCEKVGGIVLEGERAE
jgi:Lrp/AsnC family leucine-responsive transcriptional regulator